jgi:hypothetical protein
VRRPPTGPGAAVAVIVLGIAVLVGVAVASGVGAPGTTAARSTAAAAPAGTPSATAAGSLPPLPGDSYLPTPSGASLPPLLSPSAGAPPVATRIVIAALGIDLPVVEQESGYPLCNVAMYWRDLGQPGEGRATYVYAHARTGMFGAIYDLVHAGRSAQLLGLEVDVYTSDDRLFRYTVTEVRTHQTSMADAVAATSEQLWLQTSEGPAGTVGKTQVIAALHAPVEQAVHSDAHPVPSPVVCG